MADDIVTELKAHRDIDNNRCCECGHWTDHDDDCMVGRAADEIERLRAELERSYTFEAAPKPTAPNFDEWLDEGVTNGWITPPGCLTHDGLPYTDDEMALPGDELWDVCVFGARINTPKM